MADGLSANGKREVESVKLASAAAPQWFIAVLCFMLSALCFAEELPDPTHPPDSPASFAPASGVSANGTTAIHPAGLQSIIISKTRRAAIIDGETVELGGKHGDAKLIEVNEGSVVFYGAQGRQTISLFPDVKMTTTQAPAKSKVKNKSKLKSKLQSPKSKAQPDGQKATQAGEGK